MSSSEICACAELFSSDVTRGDPGAMSFAGDSAIEANRFDAPARRHPRAGGDFRCRTNDR